MIPGVTASGFGSVIAIQGTPPDWPKNVAGVTWTPTIVGGTGPYTFSIVSGSLPTGLSLNTSTGEISGTGTVGESQAIVLRVEDSVGNAKNRALTITVEADAQWENVKLLAGFNGTDGATSYTEESSSARAATFQGNAQLSTAQQKFGSASLLLDGTDDYISFADHADWTLGSGDFTIEAWLRPDSPFSASDSDIFAAHYSATANQRGWLFCINASGNGCRFEYSTDGSALTTVSRSSIALVAAEWTHIAVCRSGNNLRMFINGVQNGTTADVTGVTIFNSTEVLSIGTIPGTTTRDFDGYIDELRITLAARYTTDFTPRTLPFPRG